MKRVFISQPMTDKTKEEIMKERNRAMEVAKDKFGEDVEVIDSFIEDAPQDARPLWFLAKSIELLDTADVVIFCTDWFRYRGCRIENMCAREYCIDIIDIDTSFEVAFPENLEEI